MGKRVNHDIERVTNEFMAGLSNLWQDQCNKWIGKLRCPCKKMQMPKVLFSW